MTDQIIFGMGLLSGLAVGAVLWYGRRALADRARDGEGEGAVSSAAIHARATSAIASAVERWNTEHPDRVPVFLPLSLRSAIERAVSVALAAAARGPRADVTIFYADPIATWAIDEAGGVERIQRGIDFDGILPGTVLDGADGRADVARLGDDGEWEIQFGGGPVDPRDVRRMFIEGELVLRGGGEAGVAP